MASVWALQQLRYPEFSGGWLGLRPYLRRRQIARAEQCIRQASLSLKRCTDFRSICQVLKENLQPIGIDGIRLNLPGSGTMPARWLRPLRADSDGQLRFSWYRHRGNDRIVWQYSLHILLTPENGLAASVFRVTPGKHSYPDPAVFSDDFKTTLSTAIERATKRIDILLPAESDMERQFRTNSLPDSA